MKLSGLVITFNEENNIKKCIETLFKVCDEVIIIDSNSSDKTCEIARELGAKVYLQKFLGDGPQRIFGIQYCKNDWILNPDADEIFEEDAINFFKKQSYLKKKSDAYRFKRINLLGPTKSESNCIFIDSACRFFNKKTASPSKKKVHQRILGKNVSSINVTISHYAYDSYHQLIGKLNQYTDWQSEEYLDNNKNVNLLTPFFHSFFTFIKLYFIKKGFIYKFNGLNFAIIQAFFTYVKYTKYINLKKKHIK